MSKQLLINPNNPTFATLMKKVAKAIRTGDEKLTAQVKAEFAEYDTTLFYNAERDEIRVLVTDCPPIDFPVSQFTDLASQPAVKAEVK